MKGSEERVLSIDVFGRGRERRRVGRSRGRRRGESGSERSGRLLLSGGCDGGSSWTTSVGGSREKGDERNGLSCCESGEVGDSTGRGAVPGGRDRNETKGRSARDSSTERETKEKNKNELGERRNDRSEAALRSALDFPGSSIHGDWKRDDERKSAREFVRRASGARSSRETHDRDTWDKRTDPPTRSSPH